jgi:hypothetical protein
MTDSAKDRFVSSVRESWTGLVELARTGTDSRSPETIGLLASNTGSTIPTIRNKFRAIEYARELGQTYEQIVEAGQHTILSRYAKARKNGHNEKEKILRWRVPASLADAIQSDVVSADQEEPLVSRLVRVCKLETSEDLWTFIHSWFCEVTDAELVHHAGEGKLKKKR